MTLAERRATAKSSGCLSSECCGRVLAFTAEQNVGFLGQSRHSLIRSPMSAIDPKRTFLCVPADLFWG